MILFNFILSILRFSDFAGGCPQPLCPQANDSNHSSPKEKFLRHLKMSLTTIKSRSFSSGCYVKCTPKYSIDVDRDRIKLERKKKMPSLHSALNAKGHHTH
jgi:hypothetical protein